MKIDYVNSIGLDELMNLYEECYYPGENQSQRQVMGVHLYQVLSHMKILYKISDISILEAAELKRFANGNVIDLVAEPNIDVINDNIFKNSKRYAKTLNNISNLMKSDKSVPINPEYIFLPNKCLRRTITVSFTGMNILKILGAPTGYQDDRMNYFSIMHTYDHTPPDGKEPRDEYENNTLIALLINRFYNFLLSEFEDVDLVSDSYLYDTYIKPSQELHTLVQLVEVSNPFNKLSFLNTQPQELTEGISAFKKKKEEILLGTNTEDMKVFRKETDIFFVVSTTFYTYLELLLYLPDHTIMETEDIKIVLNRHGQLNQKIWENYRDRVNELLQNLKNERTAQYENPNLYRLEKFFMIPLSSMITYTIKLNLDTLATLLPKWEKMLENDFYGKDNYLSLEIAAVEREIKKATVSMYKTLLS